MKIKQPSGNIYYINPKTNKQESRFNVIKRNLRFIPRANNENKPLSKKARELTTLYCDLLDKSQNGVITVKHEYITSITEVGWNQNNNIHKEISAIFNISYHHSYANEYTRYRNVFAISYTENGKEILENPELFYSTKVSKNYELTHKKLGLNSQKIVSSIYIDENTQENNRLEQKDNISTSKNMDNFSVNETVKECHRLSEQEPTDLSFCLNSSFSDESKQVASLPNSRTLAEWIDDLTDQDIKEINEKAGREDFTNHPPYERHFIEKLMNKLSKPANKFHAKQAVVNYLVKALEHEKVSHHQANNPNFHVRTEEDKALDEYWRKKDEEHYRKHANRASGESGGFATLFAGITEAYFNNKEKGDMETVEEKMKLPATTPRETLQNTLKRTLGVHRAAQIRAYVAIDDSQENKIVLKINQVFSFSDDEKTMMRDFIKQAYGDNVQITAVTVADKNSKSTSSYQPNLRTPLWNKIRHEIAGCYGEGIMKSWFDKARVEETDESKKPREVFLHTTDFFANYINSNYSGALDKAAKNHNCIIRIVYNIFSVDSSGNEVAKTRDYYYDGRRVGAYEQLQALQEETAKATQAQAEEELARFKKLLENN